MPFKMIDLTPRIGTEIRTDVDTLLSGKVSGEIRALLEQRGVIAIRELNLTDAQQVTFTKTLGNIVEAGQGLVTKIKLRWQVGMLYPNPESRLGGTMTQSTFAQKSGACR